MFTSSVGDGRRSPFLFDANAVPGKFLFRPQQTTPGEAAFRFFKLLAIFFKLYDVRGRRRFWQF
jgi:hypothetical protein